MGRQSLFSGYTSAIVEYHEMLINPTSQPVVASAAAVVIALGLASIVFFSTVFIVVALLIRNRWDDMAGPHDGRKTR